MSTRGPQLILHVEDSDVDADTIAHLLQDQPYSIERARTYGEMMDFAAYPDVILLDLRIPGSNDPFRLVADATRRFKESAIILVTDLGDARGADFAVRSASLGVMDRLLKNTFDGDVLDLKIRESHAKKEHVRHTVEQSRSDMKATPDMMRDLVGGIIDEALEERFESLSRDSRESTERVLRRLKSIGATDTEPHTPIFRPIDSDVDTDKNIEDYEKSLRSGASGVAGWLQQNPLAVKIAKWLVGIATAAYVYAGDYFKGIHNKITDTHERVLKIEKKIEELGHDQ